MRVSDGTKAVEMERGQDKTCRDGPGWELGQDCLLTSLPIVKHPGSSTLQRILYYKAKFACVCSSISLKVHKLLNIATSNLPRW